MKKLFFTLAAFVLALLLARCGADTTNSTTAGNNDSPAKQISFADIAGSLSAKAESFEINQTKDTLIKCKKGTVVYLPANSLQFEDGTSPKGAVQIDIKECYSLTDFIGDSLSTVSDEKILETAGMVNINATAEGKQVFVKKQKEYAIYFPKKIKQEEMQLFYGDRKADGVINWIPKNKIDSTEIILGKPQISGGTDSVLLECKPAITAYLIPVPGYYLRWKRKNGSIESIHEDFWYNFKSSKSFKKYMCDNKDLEINVEFDLEATSGKIKNILFEENPALKKEFEKEISNYLIGLPPIDLTIPKEKSNVISQTTTYLEGYTQPLTIMWLDGVKHYKLTIQASTNAKEDFKKGFDKKYNPFKNKAITKIDKAELNYYVLSATQFGWINCDKFWNSPDEKINYYVTTKSPDTRVQIVFSGYNSIMQGSLDKDKFVFNNVPINSKIKIIGISYDNGKPVMSSVQTTVSKSGFELTGFKEFTLAQLETELNKAD